MRESFFTMAKLLLRVVVAAITDNECTGFDKLQCPCKCSAVLLHSPHQVHEVTRGFQRLSSNVNEKGKLSERLKHLWKPPEWERSGHTPIHTWTTVQMDGKQTGNTAAEEVETAKTDSKMVEVK